MYVEGDAALGHVICQDFNPRASSVIYVVGGLTVKTINPGLTRPIVFRRALRTQSVPRHLHR